MILAGPAVALEVAVDHAEARKPVVAVICHPLPTEGGSMHNKVVTMAARALRECGQHVFPSEQRAPTPR